MVNVHPCPSPSECTDNVPPCKIMIPLETANRKVTIERDGKVRKAVHDTCTIPLTVQSQSRSAALLQLAGIELYDLLEQLLLVLLRCDSNATRSVTNRCDHDTHT